jgi:hypothetical protein
MSEDVPPYGNYVYPCPHCGDVITVEHSDLRPVTDNLLRAEWQCSLCNGWAQVLVAMPDRELKIKKGPAADVQPERGSAASVKLIVGATMSAVSIEAKAVLDFMAKVQKMRALSAVVEKINPAVAEETRRLNLQVARGLRRQRKILQEFLDGDEGTADDRTVAAEYLRLVIHAQAELKAGGIEAVS